MDELDIYYRAFKQYRKETENQKVTQRQRIEYKKNGIEFDHFEVTKFLCKIDSDWVQEIEKGLVYVEKAVREERQFIRTNGEIVPIEKAKRVSKDSVEHLAKHSNMITHVPEDGNKDLIPDSIYMVERLSDYAVYENRFLYLLLCYLRDFINLRLEKIKILRNTLIEDLEIKKDFKEKNEYNFNLKYYNKIIDNPFPIPDEKNEEILYRIESCQSIILMLLSTDLMIQVSKSPMIKPPIVKTNVLKMNNNFKNALSLYDYITSYNKQGYEAIEVKKKLNPFSEKINDELAEVICLTNHLSYKFGNDLEDYLEKRYIDEEKRRIDEENSRLAAYIERLKKRLAEDKSSIDEYIILLEKRNKMLESDSEELKIVRNEVIVLNKKIDELNNEKKELNRIIAELEDTINKKIKEINDLNEDYLLKIKQLEEKHLDDLAKERYNVGLDYEKKFDDLRLEIEELNEKHQNECNDYYNKINDLNKEIADCNNDRMILINEYEQRIKELNNKYNIEKSSINKDFNNQINLLKSQNEKTNEELLSATASLNALRAQNGSLKPVQELTAKEKFLELEEQYLAFNDFFKKQWKLTKKEIRKELLWTKEEKKKIKKNKKEFKKYEEFKEDLENNDALKENKEELNEDSFDTNKEENVTENESESKENIE